MEARREALGYPGDGASFTFDDGPVPLMIQDGAAVERDRADRSVGFLLRESGAKVAATSVARESKVARALDGGISNGKGQTQTGTELCVDGADEDNHLRG